MTTQAITSPEDQFLRRDWGALILDLVPHTEHDRIKTMFTSARIVTALEPVVNERLRGQAITVVPVQKLIDGAGFFERARLPGLAQAYRNLVSSNPYAADGFHMVLGHPTYPGLRKFFYFFPVASFSDIGKATAALYHEDCHVKMHVTGEPRGSAIEEELKAFKASTRGLECIISKVDQSDAALIESLISALRIERDTLKKLRRS